VRISLDITKPLARDRFLKMKEANTNWVAFQFEKIAQVLFPSAESGSHAYIYIYISRNTRQLGGRLFPQRVEELNVSDIFK
jgi:hypothetical protein